ncbi:hypothetical protein Goari_022459 [Gossypium aridum]|uniref:Uncharacterized protein n=1 Tax=Gossypium aridum TaxID=34290 RepID=A0A7J8YUE0_GOSAI|nr:hypothetical protein [Gossypium aridum]
MGIVPATIFTSRVNAPYSFPLIIRTIKNCIRSTGRRELKYIYIWEHGYDFIPMCELILALELATSLKYMTWFRHHGKPYLLPEEQKTREHCRRSPRRTRMNPRLGVHAFVELSSTPNPQVASMAAPPPYHYPSIVSQTHPVTQRDDIQRQPSMTRHSSTEERKENKDKDGGQGEDEDNKAEMPEHQL